MIDASILNNAINARQKNVGIAEVFGKKPDENQAGTNPVNSAMAGNGLDSIMQKFPIIKTIIGKLGGGV